MQRRRSRQAWVLFASWGIYRGLLATLLLGLGFNIQGLGFSVLKRRV